MPSKRIQQLLLGVLISMAGGLQGLVAAELSTLFTTPQERQIINSNRYKSDEVKTRPVVVEDVTEAAPTQFSVREEVTQEYKISGITISRDGPHTVWINSIAYEDGEQLEDTSKIEVVTGDEVRVRITAPDGRKYFASSGETLEVSYLKTVQN